MVNYMLSSAGNIKYNKIAKPEVGKKTMKKGFKRLVYRDKLSKC